MRRFLGKLVCRLTGNCKRPEGLPLDAGYFCVRCGAYTPSRSQMLHALMPLIEELFRKELFRKEYANKS
jgi:hypothetical protein